MINEFIQRTKLLKACPIWDKSHLINRLIQSRNLFAIQTIEYEFVNVCSMDIDESGNFLIAGLSNGSVDLQGIQDPTLGTLDHILRLSCSPFNLHRVQWNPVQTDQIFSVLDNHNLYMVDPVEQRVLERFNFTLKTNWSEWNPSDKKMIAVCGSESQVRLVDICCGSSVQTIVLEAKSGLASHRPTRCLWSRQDINCLVIGDNEGYIHMYDTRHSTRPLLLVGEEGGQISGMSFTSNQNSIITSQGTENHLVQWYYDKCSLVPVSNKFRKPEKPPPPVANGEGSSCISGETLEDASRRGVGDRSSRSNRTIRRRIMPLPVDAYLRCQFYVSDRHVFCPVPPRVIKSKEIYIYDIETGLRIKTLKSDDILRQGVFSVVGLLPEALVIYVGGRGRLRAWSIDEGHQRKMEERMNRYHQTRWDSDEELP